MQIFRKKPPKIVVVLAVIILAVWGSIEPWIRFSTGCAVAKFIRRLNRRMGTPSLMPSSAIAAQRLAFLRSFSWVDSFGLIRRSLLRIMEVGAHLGNEPRNEGALLAQEPQRLGAALLSGVPRQVSSRGGG